MRHQELEASLEQALSRHLAREDGRTPKNLEDSIRYSLLAPGKRIRPRLALACASMVGLPLEAALPAALSIEMIHCFTLIHDDLPCMDDDDFRRGRPSNHKVYGEGIALLAGDALMALAVDVFLDCAPRVDSTRVVTALKRLNWAMGPRGVMGGQAAESILSRESKLEELRVMHAMKTGALFSASLLVPMDLTGIAQDSPRGAAIKLFAEELGLAFQVADDLDDATEETAKSDPTSVLFYMSPEAASADTSRRLKTAMEGLEREWKDAAAPLLRIAEEVLKTL